MLLEATPVPLIHPFEDVVLQTQSADDCLGVVNQLSATKKQTLIYVVRFLREVLEKKNYNRLNINRLGG